MRFAACLSVLLLSSAPAQAHPHMFLDTGLNPVFNDKGQLAGVRVIWLYDAFYSLLMIEEGGFDADGDGQLSESEEAALAGFDQNPDKGYTGTTRAYLGDRELALSPPVEPHVTLEAGQLISTHLRLFEEPLDPAGAPVFLRTFDPTYYAAFDLSLTPRIEGEAECTLAVVEPDEGAANADLEALLASPSGAGYDEYNFPEVGETFADTLKLDCRATG
ncbi:DUF1007 family protein [Oceaniglobus trochenteri]|uniref:DUF1007 family protein n=1 Tax=Oceaniglobus trochenteri TaxID=2763260 RepID=UPI001CFF5C8F|nr:DUF1007 family protein [Oceaniglobus trochenteri]